MDAWRGGASERTRYWAVLLAQLLCLLVHLFQNAPFRPRRHSDHSRAALRAAYIAVALHLCESLQKLEFPTSSPTTLATLCSELDGFHSGVSSSCSAPWRSQANRCTDIRWQSSRCRSCARTSYQTKPSGNVRAFAPFSDFRRQGFSFPLVK
jgi:hypothetical protein